MKPRSPVLGYNHNVRYAQRLWHVQTEDSGVANPHIFTHLFHDGTILATKRLDYDPSVAVDIVQKLMQAQHKALLRELKQGAFDDKIGRFFGTPVVRDPVAEGDRPGSGEFDADSKTDPSMQMPEGLAKAVARPAPSPQPAAAVAVAPPSPTGKTDASIPAIAPPRAPAGAPALRPPPSPSSVSTPQPRTTTRPNLTPARPAVPVTASRTAVPAAPPRPPVTGIGGRRPAAPPAAHSYGGGKPTAEGVVVARPAVIVGDQNPMQRPAVTAPRQPRHTPPPPAAPGPQPSKTPTGDNIFGGDLISEKSLDEVILAYLSEDLNEK